MENTAQLKTDAYEYTMLSSFVENDMHRTPATFELFARKLPKGRRFGLTAGLGRFLKDYDKWTVKREHIDYLYSNSLITRKTKYWLLAREGKTLFNGNLYAYPEGSLYYPNSPIIKVEGELGEALLLETYLLSIMNYDTAVASAAARMVISADNKPIIEMGSRRTNENSAVAAARASYIAGFDSTSNLGAGLEWGIPVAGTSAHAYVLAHETEFEAFTNQLTTLGIDTTLLVDTYSIPKGIETAVIAANRLGHKGPGGIRIDSGDLLVETQKARKLLDSLGAVDTKISVSSDLDEYLMSELSVAPIDGYGVGTRVVTGSGHPTSSMVYKLVEIDGKPVSKNSDGKFTVGGAKTPYRLGREEFYSLDGTYEGTLMQEQYVSEGRLINVPSIDDVRKVSKESIESLTSYERKITEGEAKFVSKLKK